MVITGYYAYRIFLTIKAHFNRKKFNIIEYNFNYIKPSYETFITHNNTKLYDILAEKTKTEKELVNILICAFMKDPSIWVKDIIDNYSYFLDLKNKWVSKIKDFPYIFEKDVIFLINKGLQFNKNTGSFIFGCLITNEIELETFILFKQIFKFSLDNDINYKYLYLDKYTKYECILDFDVNKYKKILEELVKCNMK